MHGGDVKGQITEDKRTNVACTQCHINLVDETELSRHTRHAPDSAGSSCYACHMPEVVYGIQSFHKTHLISVPNPQITVDRGVPNACNQCHVDKSANWSIESARILWPERFANSMGSTDVQFDTAEGVRGLFAGDALTRAMMADALARRADLDWSSPYLAEAFTSDNYPIVRYFAANGLALSHSNLGKPDYLADPETRMRQFSIWFEDLDEQRSDDAIKHASELRQKRRDVDLEVGE